MRVLFVGDIVGRKARYFAQKKIVELKEQLQLDAIIVVTLLNFYELASDFNY